MTKFALDPMDLAALLSSRVCHDVISPVGAIVNGLEVLEEEKDAEMRGHALALIKSSAAEASSRLQFCRLAFGAAGSKGAAIDTGDAEHVTRQLLADERTRLEWSVPRVLMSKNKVKLLLNLCLIADATIPRGGVISVSSAGGEDDLSFTIVAKGTNARVAAAIPALLAGTPEDGAVDARAIQAYYAGLVAEASGLEVEISTIPEQVTIIARPASRERDAAEEQVEIDA
ncbi:MULTISPECIES: histidine phosphotransferase ChpT [Methylosinus]|uniref:Histidine phosphotransferase n=1 Tax=Methylosinus trichosporium (strain ATCC 35070 / NCIMB 11131 / UNIQEM 75 / OB3b) TaxID=595536 RepID=A0A2D2CZ16_METT3|nr:MULTISPECIES: histidine phosphotransferase family protein [Methylosinus]ATQ67934.1 histidine phosphotransferase [Methylosinus trichosporium OB3b]OBS53784.1 histidine phosphotransferase [Methylosinus sp. 3S-1]